jgi:hypothetical protein
MRARAQIMAASVRAEIFLKPTPDPLVPPVQGEVHRHSRNINLILYRR